MHAKVTGEKNAKICERKEGSLDAARSESSCHFSCSELRAATTKLCVLLPPLLLHSSHPHSRRARYLFSPPMSAGPNRMETWAPVRTKRSLHRHTLGRWCNLESLYLTLISCGFFLSFFVSVWHHKGRSENWFPPFFKKRFAVFVLLFILSSGDIKNADDWNKECEFNIQLPLIDFKKGLVLMWIVIIIISILSINVFFPTRKCRFHTATDQAISYRSRSMSAHRRKQQK